MKWKNVTFVLLHIPNKCWEIAFFLRKGIHVKLEEAQKRKKPEQKLTIRTSSSWLSKRTTFFSYSEKQAKPRCLLSFNDETNLRKRFFYEENE